MRPISRFESWSSSLTKSTSVWRPLLPVENAPLVLCDRRSVHRSNLVEADKVSPGLIERDYFVKYDADQKWYWLSNQRPDEVIIFKSWDSCNEASVAGSNAGPIRIFVC